MLEKPDPHLETKIRAGQRADRADVDGVERVIILQCFSRVARQRRVAAAIDETEDIVAGDFLAEPDAARTEDAALVVERDAGSERRALGLHVFLLDVARVTAAVAGGLFLQLALARLVANRAIERVIDEEEFHHALATVLNLRRVGADMEAGRRVGGAADLRPGDPVDFLFARRRIHDRRLRYRIDRQHAHFDQAHPAIADDRKLRVVAVIRHVHADQARCFDHVGALWHSDLPAVDIDGDEIGFGRSDHYGGSGEEEPGVSIARV